jgi:hypothetical protein
MLALTKQRGRFESSSSLSRVLRAKGSDPIQRSIPVPEFPPADPYPFGERSLRPLRSKETRALKGWITIPEPHSRSVGAKTSHDQRYRNFSTCLRRFGPAARASRCVSAPKNGSGGRGGKERPANGPAAALHEAAPTDLGHAYLASRSIGDRHRTELRSGL